MPINRRYPLEELLEACRQLELPRRQRITFEYLLLAGVNDSSADARKLAKLLKGLRAKINLIPFNEYPGSRGLPENTPREALHRDRAPKPWGRDYGSLRPANP
jgi:23S rRNA (adenine2503-C2)-methyltransferase